MSKKLMRLPQDDQFSYNRYLDYLHYKASEIESLKSIKEQILEGKSDGIARLKEIEDNFLNITLGKIALSEAISMRKIVEKRISKGFDNQTISDLTDLTIGQIEEVRKNLERK